MLINMILIVLGFVLLIGSANVLVDAASDIAKRFGISDRIIGLTVVAVGTSLPELMIGITSAGDGHMDMALGNVAGSCLANLLLILGLTALITPVRLSRRTRRLDIPVSILSAGVLLLFANTGNGISTLEGVVLVVLFALFIAQTVIQGVREGGEGSEAGGAGGADEADAPSRALVVNILLLLGSSLVLKVGADLVVDSAVSIADMFGLSEGVIGTTVVAIGTCLPELVTAVMAALRGNTDIAVGNVVGSNISNLLLVPGVTAIVTPISYNVAYNFDFLLVMVCTALLLVFAWSGRKQTLTRVNGACFLLLCAVYLVATAA